MMAFGSGRVSADVQDKFSWGSRVKLSTLSAEKEIILHSALDNASTIAAQ